MANDYILGTKKTLDEMITERKERLKTETDKEEREFLERSIKRMEERKARRQ